MDASIDSKDIPKRRQQLNFFKKTGFPQPMNAPTRVLNLCFRFGTINPIVLSKINLQMYRDNTTKLC